MHLYINYYISMIKSFIFVTLATIASTCSQKKVANVNLFDIDQTFTEWNKLTFKNLQIALKKSVTLEDSATFENRIISFLSYLEIQSDSQLKNRHSIRYQFLTDIAADPIAQNNMYIIEVQNSGERTEIKNFVLQVQNKQIVKVGTWIYDNREWIRTSSKSDQSLENANMLPNNLVYNNQGSNDDEVIVSQFNKFKIVESIYFPYASVLKGSWIDLFLKDFNSQLSLVFDCVSDALRSLPLSEQLLAFSG